MSVQFGVCLYSIGQIGAEERLGDVKIARLQIGIGATAETSQDYGVGPAFQDPSD